MKRPLHLDIETYSEADLKAAGAYVYAEHPSTEILVFCWAFGGDAVETWRPGDPLPEKVVRHVNEGGEVRAHNASFERVILNGVAGKRIGFPYISIEQTVCTAAKVAAHGLPRALGDAAKALEVQPKDDAGRNTMLMVSKPRRGSVPRYTRENAPEKFAILDDYCKNDVEVERAIDNAVPDLPASELLVYHLDQRINDRGIGVDLEAIGNAQYVVDRYRDELHKKCIELTGLAPTQRDKIAGWVRANGYPDLIDMQAETVKRAVADPTAPENAKTILKIFSTHGNKAVAKLESMKEAVCTDGRLKGMFLYHGANTGRWSSLKVQLQNLFRGVIPDPENAIDILSARDLDWVRAMYPGVDPMKVVASCVRGMLVPAEGKVLQAIDYAGIESRVNAWLFGEQWKLKAFRDFDAGIGPDLYALAYARAFRVRPGSVTKGQRQIGKVMELALGYEGGVGAFVTMTETYGVNLTEMAEVAFSAIPPETLESAAWMWHNHARPQKKTYDLPEKVYLVCDSLKQLWRANHPRTKEGWGLLRQAAVQAVDNPGGVYGLPDKKVLFRKVNDWLYMRLPSGRRIAYYKPEMAGDKLTYMGVDTYTRHYCRTSTYGGKLCLAGETEVLTAEGWKRIDACRHFDLLWDGVEWVYSGGLSAQGVKNVVYWEGVRLTSDHEVLTNDGWKTATLAQSEGHRRAPVSLPDRSPLFTQPQWQNVLETSVRLRERDYGGGSGADSIQGAKSEILRMQNENIDRNRKYQTRVIETPWIFRLAEHGRSLRAIYTSVVAQLRRTRDSCLQAVVAFREFLEGHGNFVPFGAFLGTQKQQSRILFEQLQMGDHAGTGQQPTRQRVCGYSLGTANGVTVVPSKRDQTNDVALPDKSRLEDAGVAETYDLVNCGPRRRFVVRGRAGEIFIVHNCENAVQAIARDVLVNGMLRIEAAGYPIVATVHDEAVAEVDEKFGSIEEAGREMCVLPDWATGLPLAVEGWRAKRYKK